MYLPHRNMIVQPRISGYVSPYRASPKLFTLFCKRYKIKNRLGGSIPLIHGCQVKNPESLSLSFVSRFTTFFMTCGSSYPIIRRFLEFTVGSAPSFRYLIRAILILFSMFLHLLYLRFVKTGKTGWGPFVGAYLITECIADTCSSVSLLSRYPL